MQIIKMKTTPLAALAAFTIAGPASATVVLFSDNFNTAQGGGAFNDGPSLTADQSGTAATQTYTTIGANFAFQRGNGGNWLMHASGAVPGSGTNMAGSLNYDIAAAANAQAAGNQALSISFNMNVAGSQGGDTTLWTSFTVGGGQNPFVNNAGVGFSSLFRDNGGTQQFSNGADLGDIPYSNPGPSFTDGQLITFVLSDATGSGSAFDVSNGANDIVKMYVGGSLTNTFTGLNLDASDQFISFNAAGTETYIDNLTITAIPEPHAALLGGLGVLALLRRRRCF
jgi:hypothetical protein